MLRTFRITVDVRLDADEAFDPVSQLAVGFSGPVTGDILQAMPNLSIDDYVKIEEEIRTFKTLFDYVNPIKE